MNEQPERMRALHDIVDKLDEIQKRPIYDTQEAIEVEVCENWIQKFENGNESLHGMEIAYFAFAKWKVRWIRGEIPDVDTNDDSTYYKSINEYLWDYLVDPQC